MNVIIDGIDFWDNFDCMKYWSPAKTTNRQKWREELKYLICSGSMMGSIKVDGIWSMIIRDNDGNFHLRSRTKNVQGTFTDKAEWIPDIIKDLDCIPNGTVLLGEIYKYGDEGSRKVTAILNCLKEKSLERQKKTPLHFYCFDVLAYKNKSLINKPIEERINRYLNYELLDVLKDLNYVEIAEYYTGEELWKKIAETLANGREGMVVQKLSAPYTCGKRTAKLTVKIKKEIANTIDVFIDGSFKPPTMEYSGKNLENWPLWVNVKTNERFNKCMYNEYLRGETLVPVTRPFFMGWASAISVSLMKDGKPTHIAWLSGIPDSIKEKIVTEPETLVNKVIEVNAMMVEKIDGEYSLRHAVVENWDRTDKRPEDCEWSQIEELA